MDIKKVDSIEADEFSISVETVEEIKGGYKLNRKLFVPKDTGNQYYRAIIQWIEKGGEVIPEKPLQLTPEEEEKQITQRRVGAYIERMLPMLADFYDDGSTTLADISSEIRKIKKEISSIKIDSKEGIER